MSGTSPDYLGVNGKAAAYLVIIPEDIHKKSSLDSNAISEINPFQ